MDDKVIFIWCPHCGTGWYGKVLDVVWEKKIADRTEAEYYELDKLLIEGLAPTDITKPLTCLACGGKYQVIEGGIAMPENGWERIEVGNARSMVMIDWVADRVMKTKG